MEIFFHRKKTCNSHKRNKGIIHIHQNQNSLKKQQNYKCWGSGGLIFESIQGRLPVHVCFKRTNWIFYIRVPQFLKFEETVGITTKWLLWGIRPVTKYKIPSQVSSYNIDSRFWMGGPHRQKGGASWVLKHLLLQKVGGRNNLEKQQKGTRKKSHTP